MPAMVQEAQIELPLQSLARNENYPSPISRKYSMSDSTKRMEMMEACPVEVVANVTVWYDGIVKQGFAFILDTKLSIVSIWARREGQPHRSAYDMGKEAYLRM